MIEFTEEDRARVKLIASGCYEVVELAADTPYLCELAERPAGDAGLREWLRSDKARRIALKAASATTKAKAYEVDVVYALAALADSTEGGDRRG